MNTGNNLLLAAALLGLRLPGGKSKATTGPKQRYKVTFTRKDGTQSTWVVWERSPEDAKAKVEHTAASILGKVVMVESVYE